MEDYGEYIIAKREKSEYLPISARNQYKINKKDIKVCR